MASANMVQRRVQFSLDAGTIKSAEYIIKKAGISPANLMSMIYSEIANTGKIPVDLKASDEDMAKANIIRASYNLPTVKLDNDKAIRDFLEDDGGY